MSLTNIPGWHVSGFEHLPSTNSHLLELAAHGSIHRHVVWAQQQSSGRGQRRRQWHQAGMAASWGWRWTRRPQHWSAVGIVVGMAVVRALAGLGYADLKLKWPNDLLLPQAGTWGKAGGILVESREEQVVIGIGLNFEAPQLPPVDKSLAAAALLGLSTEQVLAPLSQALAQELEQFEQSGLEPVLQRWGQLDAWANQAVVLFDAHGVGHRGINRGLGPDGALLLQQGQGFSHWFSGQLRLQSGVE